MPIGQSGGGDLYSAPNDEKNYMVRTNIKAIITTFDKDEYIQRYGDKKAFDIVYGNPVAKYIKSMTPHKNGEPWRIMINNSTDETTLEMLDILAKFKNENIKIITNLSYETFGMTNVKQQILEKGKQLFGDKFSPIMNWLSPQKYVKFLSSVDIYISNQNRQQGVGNMSACMLLGKKVFIKSNISTFKRFKKFGITVFDTHKIKNMSFNEFIYEDKSQIEENAKILTNRLSEQYQIKLWENIFND